MLIFIRISVDIGSFALLIGTRWQLSVPVTAISFVVKVPFTKFQSLLLYLNKVNLIKLL